MNRFALFVIIGFLGQLPNVFAGSHDVKACVLILDTRTATSTSGKWISADGLGIEVWIKVLGIWWNTGTLTANSSGCINGVLSGIGVPNETEIELRAKLQTTSREVQDIDGSIYYFSFGSKSVKKGKAADYGDFFIGESTTPSYAHGAFLLWDSAHRVAQEYKSVVGSNFPYLPMEVRYPDPNWSYGTADHVRIAKEHLHDLSTLRHEFGHNLAANDSSTSTGGSGDYCTDFTGSSYPLIAPPYLYKDTSYSSVTKDCHHSNNSYEQENDAAVEGFAEFFADLLAGECTYDPSKPYRLNFDRNHRENNFRRALCDLADSGADNQSVSEKHYYYPGAYKGLTEFGSFKALNYRLHPVDSGIAYIQDGLDLHSIPVKGGTVTTSRVQGIGASTTALEVQAGRVCYSYPGTTLFCGLVGGTVNYGNRPTGITGSWLALRMVGNSLYGLFEDSTSIRIEKMSDASGAWDWTWVPVYQEAKGASEPISSFAVDSTESRLVILRDTVVDQCMIGSSSSSIPDCMSSTTSLLSGRLGVIGYSRGAATDTFWMNPTEIRFYGPKLVLKDYHGIADIDPSSGVSSQFVGLGEDSIFANNLHRRSLDFPNGALLGFAMDGAHSILHGDFNVWNEQRAMSQSTLLFRLDEGPLATEEIYCGQDSFSKAPRDLVRLYSTKNFSATMNQALGYIPSLSISEKELLKEVSWIKPLSNPECSWKGAQVIASSTSTSSRSRSSTGEDSTSSRRDTGPGTPGWDLPRKSSSDTIGGAGASASPTRSSETLIASRSGRASSYRLLPSPTTLTFTGK